MSTMCGHHVSNAHMSASRLTAQAVCLAKIIDASIFRNRVCGFAADSKHYLIIALV